MKDPDSPLAIVPNDEPSTRTPSPSVINIEKVLEDHLPSEIERTESKINSLMDSLQKEEAKLSRLKLLNRIILND